VISKTIQKVVVGDGPSRRYAESYHIQEVNSNSPISNVVKFCGVLDD
jgi:hypothetical protein